MKADKQEIFKYAGWLGAALLVGGYLRYLVREEMGTFDKSLLMAGAVLLVLSLALNFGEIMALFGRRSTKLGANTAVLTIAVLAILGVINFLGYRHHKRVDLTSEQLYSLSDQTRKAVTALKQEVRVIKFDKADDLPLRDQMAEFRDLSGKLKYDRIDPTEKPQLARQYNVRALGDLVVASGERIEHLTTASEQDLTNAILKVTRDKLKNICFIEDHGEKPVSGNGQEGLAGVERGLKSQNYTTKTVSLLTGDVPPDCDVLISAGPKKAYAPQTIAALSKYLNNGGKALLLFDPDTDPQATELLTAWNIALGNDTVIDRASNSISFGVVNNYGAHPITKDFVKAITIFPLARSVKVIEPNKAEVVTTELLKTSERSYAKPALKGDNIEFVAGTDTKGPINIGVVATRKFGEKEARLVVIGDSDFASNGYIGQYSNGDLMLNTINYLAQDEDLISIRPKSATSRTITLTETQKNLIWLLTTIFLPALVIISGGYIWWKRR